MQFNAIIEQDKDGFYAYVPSLQGCVSQGETLEETLANIKEALELYLEDMDEHERESLSRTSCLIAPIHIASAHV